MVLITINMGCCNNRLIGFESNKLRGEVKVLIYVYMRYSEHIMYLNIS